MAKLRDIIKTIVESHVATLPAIGGQSAYEIAVDNGYTGTEQEWLLSLKGEKGIDGTIGRDGYTPIKNIDYFDGERGLQGIPGIDGEDGSDATVTKSAVESVLTGEISSHSHAGGLGGLTQAQILTRQL